MGNEHPFHPPDIILSGNEYVPNEWDVLSLILTFGTAWALILGITLTILRRINPHLKGSDQALVLWFVLTGSIHIFFEGYFVFNNPRMASRQDFLGQLWKEYALSDSRYMFSDSFVLCAETLTVIIWGPIAFITAVLITKGSPYRHSFQALVSTGQLHSNLLYYSTSLYDEYYRERSYCRPEQYYFWVYFVFMNAIWLVVPGSLFFKSWHEAQDLNEKIGPRGIAIKNSSDEVAETNSVVLNTPMCNGGFVPPCFQVLIWIQVEKEDQTSLSSSNLKRHSTPHNVTSASPLLEQRSGAISPPLTVSLIRTQADLKMKLSTTFLTLCLSTIVASKGFSIQVGGQKVLDDKGGPVPGENPLTYCKADHDDDLFVIDHVNLDPNPPSAGASLSIDVVGKLLEDIEKNAFIILQVKYGLIRLVNMQTDLCDQVSNVDLECPIKKGKTTISKIVDLPNEIPPGKYTVFADAYTADKKKILCLEAEVTFSR